MGYGFITLSQKLLGFLTSVLLVKLLSPSDFGGYSLVLNTINLLTLFILFGFPQLISRQISVYLAQNEYSRFIGVTKFAEITICTSTFVTLIACSLFLLFADHSNTYKMGGAAWVGLLLLVFSVILGYQQAYLRGLDQPIHAVWPVMILQPSVFLSIVGIGHILHWNFDIQSVLFFLLIASLIAIIVMSVISWYLSPARTSTNGVYDIQIWMKSLLPFFAINCFTGIMLRADLLILGGYSLKEEVGYYSIAQQMALVINIPIGIVTALFTAQIASMYAKNNLDQVRRLYAFCSVGTGLLSLAGFSLFWVGGEQILSLVFGHEYVNAYQPMVILSISFVVSGILGPSDLFMSMAGYERKTLLGYTVAAILNLVLNFMLIPIYGLSGAAIATCVSIVTARLTSSLLAYKCLEIFPGPTFLLILK